MKHTKEPWDAPEYFCWWHEIPRVGKFDSREDAERARACVNYLSGIDLDGLPSMEELLDCFTKCAYPPPPTSLDDDNEEISRAFYARLMKAIDGLEQLRGNKG